MNIDDRKIARVCRGIANALDPLQQPEFDWQQLPLEATLSTRTKNILATAGVHTWGDLLNCSERDLSEYRNCGETTLTELRAFLSKYQLSLK